MEKCEVVSSTNEALPLIVGRCDGRKLIKKKKCARSFSYLILVPIDVGTVGDACPDDVFLASAGSVKQLFVLCRLKGRTMAATNKKRRIQRKMQVHKKKGRTMILSILEKCQKRPRRCRERFAVLMKKKESETRQTTPYRLRRICSPLRYRISLRLFFCFLLRILFSFSLRLCLGFSLGLFVSFSPRLFSPPKIRGVQTSRAVHKN